MSENVEAEAARLRAEAAGDQAEIVALEQRAVELQAERIRVLEHELAISRAASAEPVPIAPAPDAPEPVRLTKGERRRLRSGTHPAPDGRPYDAFDPAHARGAGGGVYWGGKYLPPVA